MFKLKYDGKSVQKMPRSRYLLGKILGSMPESDFRLSKMNSQNILTNKKYEEVQNAVPGDISEAEDLKTDLSQQLLTVSPRQRNGNCITNLNSAELLLQSRS